MQSVCDVRAFSLPTDRFIFHVHLSFRNSSTASRDRSFTSSNELSLHKDHAVSLYSTASKAPFLAIFLYLCIFCFSCASNSDRMESPEFQTEGRHAKRERDEEENNEAEDYLRAVKQRRSWSDLLNKDDDDAAFAVENLSYDQELISGVMKSLADEITGSSPTLASSEAPPCVYDSASSIHIVSDENACSAAPSVDLEYLLGATDDELGIPPSPNYLAENEIFSGVGAEIPAKDLLEPPRPEPQAEGLLQFCDSDCWYLPYEYDVAMLNDSLYQDWQTRSLLGDSLSYCYGSLSMEKARM